MACGDRGKGRTIPLAICVAGMLIAGCIGYLWADPGDNNDRVYLRSSGGSVLFAHAAHAALVDGCIDCHHDLAGDVVTECADCHDDSYTPDLLDHDELLEIEDHECAGCHEIVADEDAISCRECHEASEIAGIYHTQCNTCHLDVSPEQFAGDDGAARCNACHLK